ncbi:MAG: DUF4249 domain-containing protein [Chitinophagales bacterium]|nr:DUF4249 domain-containing protein [Chitinophagaceae bacterium]MCB9065714.1 DUF4249 domain-containing protein [Chitinophagales bacterium]
MRYNLGSSSTGLISGVAAFVLSLFFLLSCEKEVDINLKTGDPKLVVEGGIENGYPPFVLLSTSIGYFQKIDLTTLENSAVHGAEVYVSDGIKTIRLKEYSLDTGFNGANKFYYYGVVDLRNPTIPPLDSLILGEFEKMYKLTVIYQGKTYESHTKIPTPTPLDSVITKVPDRPDIIPNSRTLEVFFKDPDTPGNCMRYYTQRNSEPLYPALNSVFNDEIINGKQFKTELPLAEPRSTTTRFDSLGVCYVGDTVLFKWTAIDKNVYDFWNTYEYALGTLGSPFATPIQVKSNISNGALGIWAGYGAIYDTLIAK